VEGVRSDTLSPRFTEVHRCLLERLPRSGGVVVPDAAHLMQIEAPSLVAEALPRFWARNPLAAVQEQSPRR
jgi:pimeloyl-ACP methyl ester carboxylesterase